MITKKEWLVQKLEMEMIKLFIVERINDNKQRLSYLQSPEGNETIKDNDEYQLEYDLTIARLNITNDLKHYIEIYIHKSEVLRSLALPEEAPVDFDAIKMLESIGKEMKVNL